MASPEPLRMFRPLLPSVPADEFGALSIGRTVANIAGNVGGKWEAAAHADDQIRLQFPRMRLSGPRDRSAFLGRAENPRYPQTPRGLEYRRGLCPFAAFRLPQLYTFGSAGPRNRGHARSPDMCCLPPKNFRTFVEGRRVQFR